MQISFQFDLQKAIQAMAFIVHRLGSVEKVKLIKLLYIADRDHFLAFGHPITGDDQYAMKHGPVPSACLDVLDGDYPCTHPEAIFSHIQIINNEVFLRQPPVFDGLAQEECATLTRTIETHGKKRCWDLVDETHGFPEYREVYVVGTSRPIPYEVILKHYAGGDERKWRKNRPVISPEMASKMNSPFRDSEPNL